MKTYHATENDEISDATRIRYDRELAHLEKLGRGDCARANELKARLLQMNPCAKFWQPKGNTNGQ